MKATGLSLLFSHNLGGLGFDTEWIWLFLALSRETSVYRPCHIALKHEFCGSFGRVRGLQNTESASSKVS